MSENSHGGMIPQPAQRISQQQLESYLWGAATLLRGYIDAGDYKQYIFPLLFFKRISDIYDEEFQRALEESGDDMDYAGFAELHRVQIPTGAHWADVRAVATNVGRALQTALHAVEKANQAQLYGVFGDAQWTNKERLSDTTLRNLVEHFSTLTLSLANVPEDELGQAYEFLIKKFADDSGHTAAEFYTNRTVVHLMTLLLEPQPGESIYDPTCGSGGMLLSAVAELRRRGLEYRTLRLYGQERNLMNVQWEIEQATELAEEDPRRLILPVMAFRCKVPQSLRDFTGVEGRFHQPVSAALAAEEILRGLRKWVSI